jgi:hypothetical protein
MKYNEESVAACGSRFWLSSTIIPRRFFEKNFIVLDFKMFRNYWNFGSIKNKHFPSTDKIQKGMRNILS